MGCCGCDNKTSAKTAGIFGIIQCIVGFSLAIYNLKIFNSGCFTEPYTKSEKDFMCRVLFDHLATIRAVLIVVLILYIFWLISSIILLVGNAQNKAGYVRQWVILSTIVIICDIIFPAVIVGVTSGKIFKELSEGPNRRVSLPGPFGSIHFDYYVDTTSLAWNYVGLLVTFSRGGLITWCCDIALTVFVNRRVTEIANPPATYVYSQAFPATSVVTANYPAPQQYLQQGFIPPQQSGYVFQPLGQQYYQPGQFNQPQGFQPQATGSNNMCPPSDYSSNQKQKF